VYAAGAAAMLPPRANSTVPVQLTSTSKRDPHAQPPLRPILSDAGTQVHTHDLYGL
jgi:hypothetical protein